MPSLHGGATILGHMTYIENSKNINRKTLAVIAHDRMFFEKHKKEDWKLYFKQTKKNLKNMFQTQGLLISKELDPEPPLCDESVKH